MPSFKHFSMRYEMGAGALAPLASRFPGLPVLAGFYAIEQLEEASGSKQTCRRINHRESYPSVGLIIFRHGVYRIMTDQDENF
jgi:hypothetical protein